MSEPATDLAASLLGVLGRPIAHSLSPRLHEAGLEALGRPGHSIAVDLGAPHVASVLRGLAAAGCLGVNVTAPHKERALALATAATAAAQQAGSANCLRASGSGYEATNTDGSGFLAFLQEIGWVPRGVPVVLLGGGGAAAGLAPALAEAGAAVSVVARRPERVQELAGLSTVPTAAWGSAVAEALVRAASLVVNATPLGAHAADALPCDPEWLSEEAVAVDLRYGAEPSAWVRAARASGRTAHDGLGLLLHQCAHSFDFWFGTAPPISRLREAVPWPTPGDTSRR